MVDHDDHIDASVLKWMPDILRDPTVIAEANANNTVNVFAEKSVGNSPVMVAVMMTHDRNGRNIINKVKAIHARRDFMSRINDDNVLYLNPDKKRTQDWFQARGNDVPLGGTKFGFIRSIAQPEDSVRKFSIRTLTPSDRDMLMSIADKYATTKPQKELLGRYRAKTDELIDARARLEEARSHILRLQRMILEAEPGSNGKLRTERVQYENRAKIYETQINRLNEEVYKFLQSKTMQTVLSEVMDVVNSQEKRRKKMPQASSSLRHNKYMIDYSPSASRRGLSVSSMLPRVSFTMPSPWK